MKTLEQALRTITLAPQALEQRQQCEQNLMDQGCNRLEPHIESLKAKLIEKRSEAKTLIERLPDQAKEMAQQLLGSSAVDLTKFSPKSDMTQSLFPSVIKERVCRYGKVEKDKVYAPGRGSWLELGKNQKECNTIKNKISICTRLLENVGQLKALTFDNLGGPQLSSDQRVIYNLGAVKLHPKA